MSEYTINDNDGNVIRVVYDYSEDIYSRQPIGYVDDVYDLVRKAPIPAEPQSEYIEHEMKTYSYFSDCGIYDLRVMAPSRAMEIDGVLYDYRNLRSEQRFNRQPLLTLKDAERDGGTPYHDTGHDLCEECWLDMGIIWRKDAENGHVHKSTRSHRSLDAGRSEPDSGTGDASEEDGSVSFSDNGPRLTGWGVLYI